MDHIPFGFGLGMVAGKAEIGVDRRRKIVDFVSCRNSDVECVGIAYWLFKFDGELAWLPSFEDSARLTADDARPHRKLVAGAASLVLLPMTRGRTSNKFPATFA